MKTANYYDNGKKIDEVWYDSSTIVYSKMVEDEEENKGNLFVTFKNGSTYKYIDVLFTDYLLFKNGGLDSSNGKALNHFIKGKYDYERVEDINVLDLQNRQEQILTENKKKEITYFISGHGDITPQQFEFYYEPAIDLVLLNNPDACFVVGDFKGADTMAQDYLLDSKGINPENITVYHMFDSPRYANIKVIHTKGGFATDEERDSAMTENSSFDIAFVRDNTKISGTAQNILRRFLIK